MNIYKKIVRPFLFRFDPERVHRGTFFMLKAIGCIPLMRPLIRKIYTVKHPSLEKTLMGITFPNPVGLAAGFDKDAELFQELSDFGFGFIEIGTLTPLPQSGNPKKRLFRLKEDAAIINRMGFNNKGVKNAARRLSARRKKTLVGGNIGKNKTTPNENAFEDYKKAFSEIFPFVDYFTINVSSPNTLNLRELQEKEPLQRLLEQLQALNNERQPSKPIFLKIAPDLSEDRLLEIIDVVKTSKIAGIIATNTTTSREGLRSEFQAEAGGLSGKPLRKKSTEVIEFIASHSDKSFVIIGVGGICSVEDALEKLEAGADLIQIYTGFIYEGPSLVKAINKALIKKRAPERLKR